MKKWTQMYKSNAWLVFFALCLSFFLLCSYVYGNLGGFQTAGRFFLTILITILITPIMSLGIIKLSNITINGEKERRKNILDWLYGHYPLVVVSLFLMHLPFYLAVFPGICYYDIPVQIEQYEKPYFIENHPLIHTLYLGFFKNLFEDPNAGYAIATLIQLLLVEMCMALAISYIYKKTQSKLLCTIALLFYGMHPVNSLLSLSTTKDIFFSICMLLFFLELKKYFIEGYLTKGGYVRLISVAVLMLLLRNNAKHAFIPAMFVIVVMLWKKKKDVKKFLLLVFTILAIFVGVNKVLVVSLNATPGSIKEMMSIPVQELGRIYNTIDDEQVKEEIREYVPDAERYNYYLSDALKVNLPFEILDSKCKHFLLFTFIKNFEYPITCIDAIFYSTQGYWDLFHCPYIEDHFYLVQNSDRWWGGSTLDSKIPALYEWCVSSFHTTDGYADQWYIIFFNIALYVWIFLFYLAKGLNEKKEATIYSCLFPLLYLATLLLGPGAIVRYVFIFYLLAPVMMVDSFKTKQAALSVKEQTDS